MSNIYEALRKAGTKVPSLENTKSTTPARLSWQDISLEWKIVLLVFGFLFIAIVHQLVARALRSQIDRRAIIITTNLSVGATGHVVAKDLLQLKTLVTKYARSPGVAYVSIKDREGKVIAHSSTTFAPELEGTLSSDQRRNVGQRKLTLAGKQVYETHGPILEGQLGTAHVGIWGEAIDHEIDQILFLFLWPIALALLAAVIVAVFLAYRFIRPVRRLIDLRLGSVQPTSPQL
jgi:sensor histidine kinase regulating citrate/malate metabolism